jgi:ParB family chromosome partitioning protein
MAGSKRGLPEKKRMRHDRHYVDELAQRMGEGIGRMIRITAISSNQDQPRSTLGDLSDLVGSIETHGVLEPLLVRRVDGGDYELISGERRFHAALTAGLTEVPCIELEVSDQHALEIALIENLQRQDLSAFEEGEGYRTLIEKYSYTHAEVAKAVGRSRVTITEAQKILAIPEPIRDLCRHADITAKGILLEIARLPSEEEMAELVQSIVEERLDRAEIRKRRHQGEVEAGAEIGAMGDDQESTAADAPVRRKPFVWKYQPEDRPFRLSLSFTSDERPEPREMIQALEEVLDELKREVTEAAG